MFTFTKQPRHLRLNFKQGVSFNVDKPMIFKRKESKAHGTKKCVEGTYNKNDKCLLIDDVITSGISILETVQVRFKALFQFSFVIFELAHFSRDWERAIFKWTTL